MLSLDVRTDLSEARKFLTRTERRAVPKAASRSLNRAASRTNTIARRNVAKRMGIAQKHIKRGFGVSKASWRRLTATVSGKGKPLNLLKYKGTRQLKTKGVVSSAYGERKQYPGAFIATMPNGKRGVFVRKTRKRLPIRQVYGPSVPKTMVEDEVTSAMQDTAAETWRKEWPRNLRYYVEREQRRANR